MTTARPLPAMPTGTHDDFAKVESWDRERAETWAKALDLRASGPDQVKLRALIVEVAGLRAGQTVIEIGCGTGPLLPDLAAAVGPTGRVIGVEPQAVLAQFARDRLAQRGWAASSEVRTERAAATTLAPRSADLTIAQTVLIHVPSPEREATLEKMIALTRPGGRVMCADQDGDTWVIDHPDRALTRRITSFYCEQRFADGWWARSTRGAFMRAGLANVQSRAMVTTETDPAAYEFKMAIHRASAAAKAGWITDDEARGWIATLEARAAAGQFFTSLNFYVTVGVAS